MAKIDPKTRLSPVTSNRMSTTTPIVSETVSAQTSTQEIRPYSHESMIELALEISGPYVTKEIDKPDDETNLKNLTNADLQQTLEVVKSLPELPTSTRAIVEQVLERRLAGAKAASSLDLSKWQPTELYLDRVEDPNLGRKENILEFLGRVWEPLIAAGELPLTKIRAMDPPAYRAIFSWKKRVGEIPSDFNLVSQLAVAAQRIHDEAELPFNLKSAQTQRTLQQRRYRQQAMQHDV